MACCYKIHNLNGDGQNNCRLRSNVHPFIHVNNLPSPITQILSGWKGQQPAVTSKSGGYSLAFLTMLDNRYTLRRSNPYHTLRNRTRVVRTPGNKLVVQYIQKRTKGMICAETGKPLQGIRHLSTNKLRRLPKHDRTVSRPYGGVYCPSVVTERIITSFMDEEARAAQEKKEAAERKAAQENKKKGK